MENEKRTNLSEKRILLITTLAVFIIFGLSSHTSTIGITSNMTQENPNMMLSDGENWLTGWGYRKQHTINFATGAGTNYQIMFDVNYGSGSDSVESVYLDSKCQTDFDDIRFTDNDGNTELNYWLEEKTDSSDATFWVEIVDSLENIAVNVYIYYGNDAVSTTSSGSDTFLLFDDFEDNTLDKWSGDGDWETVSSVVHSGTYASGNKAGLAGNIFVDVNWDHGVHISFWGYSDNTYRGLAAYPTDATTYYGYLRVGHESSVSELYTVDGGSFVAVTGSADDLADDTWHHIEVGYDNDDSDCQMKTWQNGVLNGIQDANEGSGADPDGIMNEYWFANQVSYQDYVDDVIIRKWVISEPAHSTWGDEEILNYAPVNTQTPTCANLDDADNLYAKYRNYSITGYFSDANGYLDISWVGIWIYDNENTTLHYSLRYYQSIDTYQESANASVAILDQSGCSSSSSGNNLNVTWSIMIDWNFPDLIDIDIRMYVKDITEELTDIDYYEVNWDIESRLDFVSPVLSDGSGTADRGNYDTTGSITASGNLIYYGSGNNYPETDEIDVWVTCSDTADPDWLATNYENTTGTFSVSVDSADIVGLDTYTFKAVQEGTGSGGTDECHTTHTDTYVADYMEFTFATNDTWCWMGEYANVTLTAIYKYDSTVFTGSYVLTNATGIISKPVEGSYSWGLVSFSETLHGLTALVNNSVTVIFDKMAISSVTYYWTQYSIESVFLVWNPSMFTWNSNSSNVADGTRIQAYMNTTSDDWGIIATGTVGDLVIGSFNPSWYHVNISIYAVVDGSEYLIWSKILAVDILHSILLEDSGIQFSDNWITFSFHTNWNNASFTIWDNATLVGHSGSEGYYQIAKPTVVGLHNYTVLINGTHGLTTTDGQTRDYSLSDSWMWRYYKYTVNPILLSIDGDLGVAYNEVSYSGTCTTDATVTIYEDSVQVGTTTIATGDFAFFWSRGSSTTAGNIRYSIRFVNDTTIVWRNGSYSKVLLTIFRIDYYVPPLFSDSRWISAYVKTTWQNATVWIYENGSYIDSQSEGSLGWYRSLSSGFFEITINVTSGSNTITLTTWYENSADAGLQVTSFSLLNMQSNFSLLTVTTNWQNTTVDIWMNDSRIVHNAIEGMVNFTRPSNAGVYNLTVLIDGGSSSITWQGTMRITPDGVTYDYRSYEFHSSLSDTDYNYTTNYISATTTVTVEVPVHADPMWTALAVIVVALASPITLVLGYLVGTGKFKFRKEQVAKHHLESSQGN